MVYEPLFRPGPAHVQQKMATPKQTQWRLCPLSHNALSGHFSFFFLTLQVFCFYFIVSIFFLFASREFLCKPICVSLCLYVLFFLVLFYNVGFHFSFDSSHQGEGARRSQKTAPSPRGKWPLDSLSRMQWHYSWGLGWDFGVSRKLEYMWNPGDSTLKALLAQAPGKGIPRSPHSSPGLSLGCVLPVWLACFMEGAGGGV